MRVILWAAFITFVAGCAFVPKQTDQRSLNDVVDAIQFAVDDLAAEKDLWNGSEKEFAHWAGACTQAKVVASNACAVMLGEADAACRKSCPNGNCGYAHQEICRKLTQGEDRGGLCSGPLKSSSWCPAAEACQGALQERGRLCEAADSVSVPTLKQAVITLATEEANDSTASAKVMVVAFGGGAGRSATNAISLTLSPRVREEKYGSIALPGLDRPPVKAPSPAAIALSKDLKTLLTSAIKSVATEYDKKGDLTLRPPMAMAEFDVEVSLILTRSGSLGIEKAWTLPAGIEIGSTATSKKSNTLKISYSRP